MKVVAVVSVYNEEETILATLESLRSIYEIDRVVIIDDASTDNTPILLADADARVVINGSNQGKGDSLDLVVPHLEFDVLLLLDGDLGESAVEIKKILEPVIQDEADMAIARFPPPGVKGGFGLVLGLAEWGIRSLTGRKFSSPLSGQRAIKREVVDAVGGFDTKFGTEVGLTIDSIRAGYRVVEVHTEMTHRETGRDLAGFLHRGKQFIHVCRSIVRRYLSTKKDLR